MYDSELFSSLLSSTHYLYDSLVYWWSYISKALLYPIITNYPSFSSSFFFSFHWCISIIGVSIIMNWCINLSLSLPLLFIIKKIHQPTSSNTKRMKPYKKNTSTISWIMYQLSNHPWISSEKTQPFQSLAGGDTWRTKRALSTTTGTEGGGNGWMWAPMRMLDDGFSK